MFVRLPDRFLWHMTGFLQGPIDSSFYAFLVPQENLKKSPVKPTKYGEFSVLAQVFPDPLNIPTFFLIWCKIFRLGQATLDFAFYSYPWRRPGVFHTNTTDFNASSLLANAETWPEYGYMNVKPYKMQ